ncbi:Trafficking protein particle complex II-specific subunit 130 [Carex littledalei]|uniref:Trafficking protein particle complex II-specific subunit 130 n=1 Tax=Carex littledalei TaxID=544730 RepID=A0A833RKA0_9POAL|nr:Trafficking protein particle complex II-specific subunit 130 [Carex littledalei]
MANYLAQFQSIKSSCDRLVVSIEDVSDLWPSIKEGLEARLPLKKATLNNRTRNPVHVENLPAEFILTTDARLRSRFPQEQYLFWFREPYATIVLVSCEDLDEFKTILKPRLKLIVQNEEKEWFIVFVSKADPSNDQATKMAKKVYARLEVDFNTKKRERCCKYDLHGPEANFWEDLDLKLAECIRNTLDKRVQFYEDEIRKLTEQRFMPIWNFCNFFILKESVAFMFEMANLHEDALREYDELELCYSETAGTPGKHRDFGGIDNGDDQAALLNPGFKQLTLIVQDDCFREFEFRQYIFACQAKLLFKLGRPLEVATRGHSFVISFSKILAMHENALPFCFREVWVITACLALLKSTTSHYDGGVMSPDIEREFYRLQGDLYSLSRVKFMRLAYLIGFGHEIEKSPANSAALSMLPWPKPPIWPALSPDSSADVLAKEKMILQSKPREKHFNIQRKVLPLEPSLLLREANRRRAFLSVGNISELVEGHANDGSGPDANSRLTSKNPSYMSRTFSGPTISESRDRPMTLSEVYVAAEYSLKLTVSDPDLLNSLSSLEEFEKKYMELTKGAADNYHKSWWKRHGVVLDGEIAALHFKKGEIDQAAKSYEKVCALYSGEGWHELLAEILPNLAECQKILNDEAGYLSSCVRLLSLDSGLFLTKERQLFQSELVRLAHGEMKHPVPLDVSSLITFYGTAGPALELCDGDPGVLRVTVWSGFPDEIVLENLNLTLSASFGADEGVKPIKSAEKHVLKPGKNIITLDLPPQKPGSYVLGALTGQIGHLQFRSHGFSKAGPADSDDFMSYEKPTRPVLKVLSPRPLVDITCAVSSALLMNELQWIGLIIKPLDYSLKGGILHIDAGPGLKIEESHLIEIEGHDPAEGFEKVPIEGGKVALPDWASDVTTILWFPVRAIDENIARGTSSALLQKPSIVDGMRMIALKLDFGAFRNQNFERTIAVTFTDPFHVTTHLTDKSTDGTLLLQVMLQSQVKAALNINDAQLDLQDGFEHVAKTDRQPTFRTFPLVISPSSKAGILFTVSLSTIEEETPQQDSILNLKYGISGNRTVGAHAPILANGEGSEEMVFKVALALQRPVLDPCVAVGFLPFSSDCLRVGQLVNVRWRIERLKNPETDVSASCRDEVLYEVEAQPQNWMVAGRKRGHVSLSTAQGSRIEITVTCIPLVSGYVHPPQLGLPEVGEQNISCNPAGPHLVCVLPPTLSSSYCIPA